MTSERFVEMPEMHSALLVSPLSEDRDFLEKFFLEKGWELHATPTGSSALAVLRERKIPVVITERGLPVGDWKDLLVALQQLPYNPFLVVTSRIAHEHLWAEVLNLGGHDVVAKPFQAEELHWVLQSAWRSWENHKEYERNSSDTPIETVRHNPCPVFAA